MDTAGTGTAHGVVDAVDLLVVVLVGHPTCNVRSTPEGASHILDTRLDSLDRCICFLPDSFDPLPSCDQFCSGP